MKEANKQAKIYVGRSLTLQVFAGFKLIDYPYITSLLCRDWYEHT